MAVDRNDPRAGYVQVADDLRRKIDSGTYHSGERLPSGKALADQYGVAYQTIQHALGMLKAEGKVVAQGTRGTFVSSESAAGPNHSPEYLELKGHLDAVQANIDAIIDRLDQLEQTVQREPRRTTRKKLP